MTSMYAEPGNARAREPAKPYDETGAGDRASGVEASGVEARASGAMTTAATFEDNSPGHPYSTVRSLPNGLHFVSGVLPYDSDGRLVTHGDRAVETCVAELARRLAATGLTPDSLVRTTVYLTDIGWRDAVNAVYARTFQPPMPARTTIEVSKLPAGSPIEIDAVAYDAEVPG
jgi:2-iminobutanoate/2-iminopropanoate deaminase